MSRDAIWDRARSDVPAMLPVSASYDEHELAGLAMAQPQVERRRPGRIASVSPELIPLLRGQAESEPSAKDSPTDDLAPITGIAVGSLISGLL